MTEIASIINKNPAIGMIYSKCSKYATKAKIEPKYKEPTSPIKIFAGCILNLKKEKIEP